MQILDWCDVSVHSIESETAQIILKDLAIFEMKMTLSAYELHEKENHKIAYFSTVP